MKFLHLSDLHLGRRLHEVSLLEDQQHILAQILSLPQLEDTDAVLLAGDVYDKPVPSVEAVRLLDWFLTKLSERGLPVLAISGNHDSAERLAFGAELLQRSGVYVAQAFDGAQLPVVLHDDYGEVRIYLLPFVKPVHVRRVYPETVIESYTDAVRAVVEQWNLDEGVRNVLVAHQLVTGAERSDSEALSIGGLDDVSSDVFSAFDYAALGHLHREQIVGEKRNVRYCGTPLAYSFSEGDMQKSVTFVELREKGCVEITTVSLEPLHFVSTRRGSFEELMQGSGEDYLRIILTDEEDVPNALPRLRNRYPNLLRMEYDNQRTRSIKALEPETEETLSPLELLGVFYAMRNDQPMTDAQRDFAKALMEEIWEDSQ